VELELVANVTNMSTKVIPGKSLPKGYTHNSTSFLLCNTILEVQVDQEIVRKEIERF